MQYWFTEDWQIYANLAYRLGMVLVQYKDEFNTKSEKYEVSLCIAVLSTILPRNVEKFKYYRRFFNAKYFDRNIESFNDWGLDAHCWSYNTFNETRKLKKFYSKNEKLT